MKFGIMTFVTAESMSVTELGRAAEAHGFESLFLAEHSHIPTSRESRRTDGSEPPGEYPRLLDPFACLGAVAAVTSRLKLATGVCLVIQRDPIYIAKEVATVDQLSNGRFLFGIGGGWNLEEMRNHGTDPAQRWKIMRERVLAMKAIWTQAEAEFHGQFVDFDPIWQWPKPVQRPHPPILVGGAGPNAFRRVVEYGDEWMPILDRLQEPLEAGTAKLRQLAEAAGREPIPVSLFWARPDAAKIEGYRAAGVGRCIFQLPSAGRDEVLPRLEQYARLAEAVG